MALNTFNVKFVITFAHNCFCNEYDICLWKQNVCESDQEIPQLHTAVHPWLRVEEQHNINSNKTQERQLKQSNQLSLSLQDDCKTRKDTK